MAVFLSVGLFPERVSADVVIEIDYDDAFLKEYRKECQEIQRSFIVNSPKGYLTVCKSPVSSKVKKKLENGTEIQGIWKYTDENGEEWYAIRSEEDYDEILGWVRTSECFPVPDHIAFCERYQDEFTEFDPAYADAFEGVDAVTLWKYPCSGVVVADGMGTGFLSDCDNPGEVFLHFWRDPEGRLWGHIGYLYGIRNTWICLDNPAATDIEADENVLPLTPEAYPTKQEGSEEAEDSEKTVDSADRESLGDNGITLLTVGAVLSVTGVTAVLLLVLFGGQRKKNREKEEAEK